MADNVTANSGSGGASFATDDIASVHYPRMKLIHGADGTNAGDVALANGLPVQPATSAAFPVTDNSGSLTVDGTVSVSGTVTVDSELPAAAALADATANPSTASVGALALLFNGTTWDRIRGDTTNGLDVDVTRLPALVAGTANIGDVDVITQIGAANLANAQVSVTTTAANIAAARATRRNITITNHGSTDVYVGVATVTTANGMLLPGIPGASLTLNVTGAIQGIVASGTQTVSYAEAYD